MLGFAPLAGAPLGASGVAPRPLGTYTLTTAPGAFVLTGLADTIGQPDKYKLIAETGSFLLTADGDDELDVGFSVQLAAGAFTLSGGALTVGGNHGMTLDVGAFALGSSDLRAGKVKAMLLEPGAFAMAGSDATLYKATYTLPQGVGVFALAVTASVQNRRRLLLDPGTLRLTGQNVKLRGTARLQLDPGTFALVAPPAQMFAGYLLRLGPSAFRLTGGAAQMTRTFRLLADPGTFALTGDGAARAQAQPVLKTRAGTFNLQGGDAALVRPPVAAVPVATYTLTGLDASTHLTRRLAAATGRFQRQGQPVDITLTRRLVGELAFGLALRGLPVRFSIGRLVTLQAGSVQMSGADAELHIRGRAVVGTQGVYSVRGYDMGLTYHPAVPPRTEPKIPKPTLPRILKGDPVFEQ